MASNSSSHCVNRNSPQFKEIQAQVPDMNPLVLAAKISLWQEKNGLDKFPKAEDIVKIKLKSRYFNPLFKELKRSERTDYVDFKEETFFVEKNIGNNLYTLSYSLRIDKKTKEKTLRVDFGTGPNSFFTPAVNPIINSSSEEKKILFDTLADYAFSFLSRYPDIKEIEINASNSIVTGTDTRSMFVASVDLTEKLEKVPVSDLRRSGLFLGTDVSRFFHFRDIRNIYSIIFKDGKFTVSDFDKTYQREITKDEVIGILNRLNIRYSDNSDMMEKTNVFLEKLLPAEKERQRLNMYSRALDSRRIPYKREESKIVIPVDKKLTDTLYGIERSEEKNFEFHINTLNVINKFLEGIGIEQRLVGEFLNKDGSVLEGAIAAANFMEGTVDIIEDAEKRPSAWNKLPEEAAHWWYRLLKEDSYLKKMLWESHKTALKNDELYKGKYGKLVSRPEDLTEESIGQLIAEAIKRIEDKNGAKEDYSFFKKFIEWVRRTIEVFKKSISNIDPFEIAAMKILSSDFSDLLTWEEYRKLNNVVNFTEVVTEQSVRDIDYSTISDLISFNVDNVEYGDNIIQEYTLNVLGEEFTADIYDYDGEIVTIQDREVIDRIRFNSKEEMDIYVYAHWGDEHDARQRRKVQEIRDNEEFVERLLNKTHRKKSKYLKKTLRKYYEIVDTLSLNSGHFSKWSYSESLREVTRKLSDTEKEQIINTNGYTNIGPTLKILPDILKKYKKNPIVLSEPIKVDGIKKQEFSLINAIREMIVSENPGLKTISAEEFVEEAHNWLKTNYLLGFANEKNHLSYRVDQTFIHVKDRTSDEDFSFENMTEEQILALPMEERQRIANILGMTKKNPDVYHNKISLRFNDTYHLKYGHFSKSPSAWGNLTYFYTGRNKWKDAVLLHEIQNDNIEFLREIKNDTLDIDEHLNNYLSDLNKELLDIIRSIESGGKRVRLKNEWEVDVKRRDSLSLLLNKLSVLPEEQGFQQFQENLIESLNLYGIDSIRSSFEDVQKRLNRFYSSRRVFQDLLKRGGVASLLDEEDITYIRGLINELNSLQTNAVHQYLGEENIFEMGEPRFLTLSEKKDVFRNRTEKIRDKINKKMVELYGDTVPYMEIVPPAKPLPKSQRRNIVRNRGTNREMRVGNASDQLNDNIKYLFIYTEKTILESTSKNIAAYKSQLLNLRKNMVSYLYKEKLLKIGFDNYVKLIDNYRKNMLLLEEMKKEQAKMDLEEAIRGSNLEERKGLAIEKNREAYEALKQEALSRAEELKKKTNEKYDEIRGTLEMELNYFTPLVHHLIQKHINEFGKDFPMYFSGYNITRLTQGNDRTALIYAGKEEITTVNKRNFKFKDVIYASDLKDYFQFAPFMEDNRYYTEDGKYYRIHNYEKYDITEQEYNKAKQEYEKAYQQAVELRAKEIKYEAAVQIGLIPLVSNTEEISLEEGIKILNEYKKKSSQNMDRVINTIMNISGNKPIETGAIYNLMSQINGVKLIWQESIEGIRGNPGGYLVDLSNYNYNVPILYGMEENSNKGENIEERKAEEEQNDFEFQEDKSIIFDNNCTV